MFHLRLVTPSLSLATLLRRCATKEHDSREMCEANALPGSVPEALN
jgi:hypothetical protein